MKHFYFKRACLYISCKLSRFAFWKDYNDLVLLPSVRMGDSNDSFFIAFEFLHLYISLDFMKYAKPNVS